MLPGRALGLHVHTGLEAALHICTSFTCARGLQTAVQGKESAGAAGSLHGNTGNIAGCGFRTLRTHHRMRLSREL